MATNDELQVEIDALKSKLLDTSRVDALEQRLRALENAPKERVRDDRIPLLADQFTVKDVIFRPHARIAQTVAQAFDAGVVSVTMNVTTFDNNFMAEPQNDLLVCRTSCIYLVNGFMRFDHTAGTRADLYIYYNGSTPYFHCALGPALDIVNPSTMQCGGLVKLNIGNTLTLKVLRGGAGDTSVIEAAGHQTPFLEAFWVAPAPSGAVP